MGNQGEGLAGGGGGEVQWCKALSVSPLNVHMSGGGQEGQWDLHGDRHILYMCGGGGRGPG